MPQLELFGVFTPTDPETGAQLPPMRAFKVHGVGYGTLQLIYHENPDQNGVRVWFTRPGTDAVEPKEEAYTLREPRVHPQTLLAEDELLIPAMQTVLRGYLNPGEA